MVYNAMKLFMEINPQLFDDCSHDYNEHQNNADKREQARKDKWARLQAQADRMKNPQSAGEVENVDPAQESEKRLKEMKLHDEANGAHAATTVAGNVLDG